MTKSAKKKQKRFDKKKGGLSGAKQAHPGAVVKKGASQAKLEKKELKETLANRKLDGYVPMTQGNTIQSLVQRAQESQEVYQAKEEDQKEDEVRALPLSVTVRLACFLNFI